MKQLCLALMALTACAPPPLPERQRAEYTIKTATPAIGSLPFTLDATGTVSGSLDLAADLITNHPVRVGVAWLQGQFVFQNPAHQSVLVQNGQSSMPVAATAGAHPFSFALPAPPMEAMGSFATATLVAYVDVNENGVLDLSIGPPLVDHVLASTDFPQLALGHVGGAPLLAAGQSAEGSLPVFDDPLLDLVACTVEGRYALEHVCGVPVFVKPRVAFVGYVENERSSVFIQAQAKDLISLDDQPYVPSAHANVGPGQHLLRVVGPTGGLFEATFTLPEPIEVVAIQGAGFSPAGAPQFDVELKNLTGASRYEVRSGRNNGGSSLTPSVRAIDLDTRSFSVSVAFPRELPFQVNAQHPKR